MTHNICNQIPALFPTSPNLCLLFILIVKVVRPFISTSPYNSTIVFSEHFYEEPEPPHHRQLFRFIWVEFSGCWLGGLVFQEPIAVDRQWLCCKCLGSSTSSYSPFQLLFTFRSFFTLRKSSRLAPKIYSFRFWGREGSLWMLSSHQHCWTSTSNKSPRATYSYSRTNLKWFESGNWWQTPY